MIGNLVKQKIFSELFSDEEDGDIPYRYGIVLNKSKDFTCTEYYMVLWQPTPIFPVGGVGTQRPYACLADKQSLIPAYEDEKS